jgi:hypothetical protein
MKTSRWICVIVAAISFSGGPLAPFAAMAQTVQTPPPPPPGPPAVVVVSPMAPREPSTAANVGAGFLNVVYVPGKAILCGTGTLASTALMLLTFGSAYHAAVDIFNEGCGGHWVLTGYDVMRQRPPDGY